MRRILCLFLVLGLSACGVVYKMDIRQGNLIDQEMVDQLKPGMTKRQVELVMGTPQLSSPFEQDRWDYLTSTSLRNQDAVIKTLSLYFQGGNLERIEGDWQPEAEDALLRASQELQKNVPEDNRRKIPGQGNG
ncbi:MAG: outer membrane protein assembly factor BamE [Ahniella sp.]|nr:outer membrane protein assembly factor BamE [Ahniella sp.]